MTSDKLTPKNYQFGELTKAAALNRPLYVFTPLRDVNTSKMNICFRNLPRCSVQLVETFPRYAPSHEALVQNGQLIIEEKMIAAQLQVLTLQEAFGREGLTAIDCTYETAVEVNDYLQTVKPMALRQAIQWFKDNVKDESVKAILIDSFTKAYEYANGVIGVTRKEIQSARSGRAGKSYIDPRDSLYAELIGVTELSILAPEGAAANNTINSLVSQLAGVLGNNNQQVGIADLVAALAQQSEELQQLRKLVNENKESK